jgi:5-formyltetrahydrofolate cyclo-ligase
MISKKELRREALESRRSLSPEVMVRLSKEVGRNLASLPEFKRARTIAFYVAKPGEVQTSGMISLALALQKRVIVPRVEAPGRLGFFEIRGTEDLLPGAFGILEPRPEGRRAALNESQVVIVPVVAWDERGHRIGYGKGYFDRELPLRGSACAIGLALESQRVQRVPEVATDAPLDMVVTEKRVLRFGKAKP